MLEPNLTFVILTKNEEGRLGRCLQSIKFPAKVIIYDSLSTDRTLEIASITWAGMQRAPEDLVLVSQKWQGFVAARNKSLEWVTSAWVFWLDADEWLSEEVCEELSHLETLKKSEIYKVCRQSFFLGRAIRHSGWFPDRKARLTLRDNGIWKEGPYGSDVHEDLHSVSGSKKFETLKGLIYHEPFRNRMEHEETNKRYSRLMAESMARNYIKEKKSPPTWIFICLRASFKFFENFIWKLGFLDCKAGFIICWASARSLFFRYKTLRELLGAPQNG